MPSLLLPMRPTSEAKAHLTDELFSALFAANASQDGDIYL